MQVLLDGLEITVSRPTLAAALDAGRRAAEARSRVVVDATLDGAPIPPDQLDHPSQAEQPNAHIVLSSADPVALVRNALFEVVESLGTTRLDQVAAATLIHQGRLPDAMRHIAAALSAWDTARQAVSGSLALIGTELESAELHPPGAATSTTIATLSADLARLLGEVKRCVANQDWSALADCLEYDLSELADTWKSALAALAERIADQS